jgi:retron-type reverse transcriptase
LVGVRQAAKKRKQEKFTALLHHLTLDLLRDSYYALRRQAAPGMDGVTWQEYETELAGRLADLHSQVHRGAYQAQPSRRVYIPKADGRQRPLGIAALEDKLVQQAVVTLLNQIYEEDFLGFSYGFRPGRSPHQALDALSVALTRRRVNFVLDCDIRGFFDNLSQEWLVRFIQHRVADPRLLRLIQKWLKAGVSEEGQWSEATLGVPQGAVITPPTMWQTFRVWTDTRWAGFHPKDHVDRLRSDFDSFDQGANQLPPSRPIGLLQTGGDALRKAFQITDNQTQLLLLCFLVG